MSTQCIDQKRLDLFKSLINDDLSFDEQLAQLRQFTLAGLSGLDLAAYAREVRQNALVISGVPQHAVDMVGTGGDGLKTFNISTTAAFVAAGAGICIAKQCDCSSSSSTSGSLELLEALGVVVATTQTEVVSQCENYGLAFVAASRFHPVLEKFHSANQVLAEQGQLSILRLLHPLCHPAFVQRSAIGVCDVSLVAIFVEALKELGVEKAMVFYGDGLDEMTLTGSTQFAYLLQSKVSFGTHTPQGLGFSSCEVEDLEGLGVEDNADITNAILSLKLMGPKRDIVLLNAAAAIQLGYPEPLSLEQALGLAEQSLESGAAYQRLLDLKA
jgi:anthranilate phosphoribosyltransferase